MQHIFHHTERIDIKILAWFVTCLIAGALLAMIIIDPSSDEKMYRRTRPSITRRRLECEDEENDLITDYTK